MVAILLDVAQCSHTLSQLIVLNGDSFTSSCVVAFALHASDEPGELVVK